MRQHSIAEYRHTPLWSALESAIAELVASQEVSVNTAPEYVYRALVPGTGRQEAGPCLGARRVISIEVSLPYAIRAEMKKVMTNDARPRVPMVPVPSGLRLATILMSASAPTIRTEDAMEGIDYFCPKCGRTLLENIEMGTIQLAVKCFDCQTVSMPPV